MQFVYKPEGTKPKQWKRWDFDPDRLLSPEAIAIEKLTKMTYAEWGEAVTRGSMTALHALLYVMLKRDDPTLKPDSVTFAPVELDFELDDEEVAEQIAALEALAAAGDLSSDQEAYFASLREQAPGAETADEAEVPKEA